MGKIVMNIVKPGDAERLANARKRLAATARNRKAARLANTATARTVAAALAVTRRDRGLRSGRGIFG